MCFRLEGNPIYATFNVNSQMRSSPNLYCCCIEGFGGGEGRGGSDCSLAGKPVYRLLYSLIAKVELPPLKWTTALHANSEPANGHTFHCSV